MVQWGSKPKLSLALLTLAATCVLLTYVNAVRNIPGNQKCCVIQQLILDFYFQI